MSENPSVPKFGKKAYVLVAVVVAMLVCFFLLRERLSLDYLAEQEQALRAFQQEHPWLIYLLAFALYVVVTGLSLPGATVLTLLYAWFFGFFPALVLVSFASTTGATLAFLLSRYLFRDAIQSRFGDKLKTFNDALDREGAFYLFTLRLIPAVPFFVINAVMGLTQVPVRTFWWVSQIGMLAGTCVYVYAGASIPRLEQLADPSQLRAADFVDARQFAARLDANSNDPIGIQLRNTLRDQDRDWVDSFSRSEETVSDAERDRLAEILNRAIVQPSFSLKPGWAKLYVDAERIPEGERRNAERALTEANRDLLVLAFPENIKPPGRIISTRLLIAFCVLGLFPLIAKRIMQRIRSHSAEKESHVATNST